MKASAKPIVLLGIAHTNAYVVKEWASDPIPGCMLTCISKFPKATYSGMLPGRLEGNSLMTRCGSTCANLLIAPVQNGFLPTPAVSNERKE